MPAATTTNLGNSFAILLRECRKHAGLSQLTYTQQQITILMAQGRTNKEIAQMLGCSPITVRNQVSVIFRKLELKSRTQLALIVNEVSLASLEVARDILTESLNAGGRIRLPNPKKGADFEQNGLKENPLPIHYQHTMPEHGSLIVGEGKFQKAKARSRPRATYEKPQLKEGEQPERLMTVQEVINILQLPPSTVWTWLATGRLKERGRIWHVEPGGRSSPLVSQSEAEYLNKNRPPMGRPRKRKA